MMKQVFEVTGNEPKVSDKKNQNSHLVPTILEMMCLVTAVTHFQCAPKSFATSTI